MGIPSRNPRERARDIFLNRTESDSGLCVPSLSPGLELGRDCRWAKRAAQRPASPSNTDFRFQKNFCHTAKTKHFCVIYMFEISVST